MTVLLATRRATLGPVLLAFILRTVRGTHGLPGVALVGPDGLPHLLLVFPCFLFTGFVFVQETVRHKTVSLEVVGHKILVTDFLIEQITFLPVPSPFSRQHRGSLLLVRRSLSFLLFMRCLIIFVGWPVVLYFNHKGFTHRFNFLLFRLFKNEI